MIKKSLDTLSRGERESIMYAFDNHLSQYIELPNGYFIGVYVSHLPNLEILEKSDSGFAYGRIRDVN